MVNKTTDLIVPDISHDEEWQNIVNVMIDSLEETDIPEKVIEAAELMVSGWPTYKIAKKLRVKTKTVKNWLIKYPVMAQAIAVAREDVQRWRLQQLEQQFVSAVEKSGEVLSAKPFVVTDKDGNPVYDEDDEPIIVDPNAKLLGVQAQHARYIMSLFLGNKIDLNVTVRDETPVMRAKADALDYVVRQLADLKLRGEPRETVVIVQEPSKESGPLLTEDDQPRFGELGKLNITGKGVQCHVCGQFYKQLEIHVRTKHGISNDMYETVFMLPPGALRSAEPIDTGGDGRPSET